MVVMKKPEPWVKTYNNIINGQKILTFNSITEAAKHYNILQSSIVMCCRGLNKTGGGFVWKYETKGRVVI